MEEIGPNEDVPITQEPKLMENINLTPDLNLKSFGSVDEFLITREKLIVEMLVNSQPLDILNITAGSGRLYRAMENTSCFKCCSKSVGTVGIYINDHSDNQILNIQRSFNEDCCTCACSEDSINVFSGNGVKLGSVNMINGFWNRSYVIKNLSEDVILKLNGPGFVFTAFGNEVFQIVSNRGEVLGDVKKVMCDCCYLVNADSDKYTIKFFMPISIEMKALVLAACFLIMRFWPRLTTMSDNDSIISGADCYWCWTYNSTQTHCCEDCCDCDCNCDCNCGDCDLGGCDCLD